MKTYVAMYQNGDQDVVVPADVARGLYDALEWMLYEGSQTSDSEFIATRARARLALAAADGE